MSMALAPEDVDVDNEVRREDKDMIVEFARLNNLKNDLKEAFKLAEKKLDDIDNAESEAMLADEDDSEALLVIVGSSFAAADSDFVTELLDQRKEAAAEEAAKIKAQLTEVLEKQEALKKVLSARFGKAINLEE